MIKTYKIRLNPTKEQETHMWQHVGASRYIYNYMLDLTIKQYEEGVKYLGKFGLMNLLTPLKKTEGFEWLQNISRVSINMACSDLDSAFKNFFAKRNGFPKFKSRKHSKASFYVRCDARQIWFDENIVQIQKIGKIKYSTNYDIPFGKEAKFSNARVSYVGNKWILTVGVECESQTRTLTDKPMGVDLGIKDTAVVSYGDEYIVYHNINKSKKVRKLNSKLKHFQRNLSRKKKGSKNREKSRRMVADVHRRISNIRIDYIHKLTTSLIDKLPNRIVVEDLNVKGMMKNRHLARAVQEQCFGEILRQLKYKSEWAGIEFVEADRFFPSSKTCSSCGKIKSDLKLKDRVYSCDSCGIAIDRDYNAAINLMKYVA